jgi:hypothetical protein
MDRRKPAVLVAVLAAAILLPACTITYRRTVHPSAGPPGPPPWAPAHGYRRKMHHYVYYPGSAVYYARDRGVYIFFESGHWRVGGRLPDHIEIDPGHGVELELETDEPYLFWREHRQKYLPLKEEGGPPGAK